MLLPVRCYTCGKVLTSFPEYTYNKLIDEGIHPGDALDRCGLRKLCCRRMLLTHNPTLFDITMQYSRDATKTIDADATKTIDTCSASK